MRFRSHVPRDALQVFVSKRTNGDFLGLAYPGDLKFHADFRGFFLVLEPWARVLLRAVVRGATAFFFAETFFATSFLDVACFRFAGLLARSAGLSLRADFHSRSRS